MLIFDIFFFKSLGTCLNILGSSFCLCRWIYFVNLVLFNDDFPLWHLCIYGIWSFSPLPSILNLQIILFYLIISSSSCLFPHSWLLGSSVLPFLHLVFLLFLFIAYCSINILKTLIICWANEWKNLAISLNLLYAMQFYVVKLLIILLLDLNCSCCISHFDLVQ